MNPALSYIYALLSEPSTWRGIIALVTAAGVALSPDQVDKIVAAGLALIGLVGAFIPDRFKTAVLILAVLSAMTGTAPAQSPVLPWRAQIHQVVPAVRAVQETAVGRGRNERLTDNAGAVIDKALSRP